MWLFGVRCFYAVRNGLLICVSGGIPGALRLVPYGLSLRLRDVLSFWLPWYYLRFRLVLLLFRFLAIRFIFWAKTARLAANPPRFLAAAIFLEVAFPKAPMVPRFRILAVALAIQLRFLTGIPPTSLG